MVNHNDLGVPNFDASLIPLVLDDICFGWNLLHLSPTIRIPNYSSDKGTSWVRHQTSPEILSIRRWQVRYPTIVYKHIRTSAFDSISMYINDQWYTYSSHVCWAWVLFLLHRRRTISNDLRHLQIMMFIWMMKVIWHYHPAIMAMENPSMYRGFPS